MSAQTNPITERQLDLITRAHCDAEGLIEPLLTLKGGAKLKMIASLARRGLIEQIEGHWRITPAATSIVKGEATAQDVLLPTLVGATMTTATPAQAPQTRPTDDPELEDAVAVAEASWQHGLSPKAPESAKRAPSHSKQALVIEMLQRERGATIAQLMAATGWQAHTLRGTFAGALKKKLGLVITSNKPQQGERVYRVVGVTDSDCTTEMASAA